MIFRRLLCHCPKSKQLSSILRLSFSSDVLPPKTQAASPKKVKSETGNAETAVPGLSSKVLNVPSNATGPGASKSGSYKNPEYFCYHQTSYFDAEIEMAKYRIPQPSAK